MILSSQLAATRRDAESIQMIDIPPATTAKEVFDGAWFINANWVVAGVNPLLAGL